MTRAFPGPIEVASVGIQSAAASLRLRRDDVVAALVEKLEARGVGLAKHHTHDAAADEANRASRGRGRSRRMLRQVNLRRGVRDQRHCFTSERGQEKVQSQGPDHFDGQQRCFHPIGKRKDLFDEDPAEQALEERASVSVLDVIASGFEQLAILHAARANRLASPATETKVDVPDGGVAQRKASLLHRAHQIDPPAR